MRLKYFIPVRHGDYGYEIARSGLTELGIAQSNALAKELATIVDEMDVVILTSYVTRAKQTATYIGTQLGIFPTECRPLYEEPPRGLRGGDYPETMQIIEQYLETTDVLILVTHLEPAEELPNIFLKKYLGSKEQIGGCVDKGCGNIVDCKKITVSSIRPKIYRPK